MFSFVGFIRIVVLGFLLGFISFYYVWSCKNTLNLTFIFNFISFHFIHLLHFLFQTKQIESVLSGLFPKLRLKFNPFNFELSIRKTLLSSFVQCVSALFQEAICFPMIIVRPTTVDASHAIGNSISKLSALTINTNLLNCKTLLGRKRIYKIK